MLFPQRSPDRGNNKVELKSQKKEGQVKSESARRKCLIIEAILHVEA